MGLSCYAILFLGLVPALMCQVTEFVSIDCGGTRNFTDLNTGLQWISDDGIIHDHGKSVGVESPDATSQQYQRRRDFPIDDNKYCYTLRTEERRRYLVRATFLYGNSAENTYPKFWLYLDATKWSTVTIIDALKVHVKEMIIRAPSSSIDVCLCHATTGSPFISTLELRPLNLSMYATEFEDDFYLKVAARVNFGAASNEAIRYPDDPYDRIWSSDLEKRQNFLVGVAPGTRRINTTKYINTNTREYPPIKVMQTAVVGTKGRLTYRLNLEDFPANARAYAYFAEIEDLGTSESRKFRIEQPYMPDYYNAVVNIAENANGSYTLYEPSFMNATLDFVFSFSFVKTRDSTQGPLLNAIEISKYVQIAKKTDIRDVNILNSLRAKSIDTNWVDEDSGDPCVPTPWEWVTCSSDVPPRITKINIVLDIGGKPMTLSRFDASAKAYYVRYITVRGLHWSPMITQASIAEASTTSKFYYHLWKNVKGDIPPELNNMDGLIELWLDRNSFQGPIPDISNLINLQILHLENNKLTGPLPSYLGSLPSLKELYVDNNSLTGDIPSALLKGKVILKYEGNPGLRNETKHKRNRRVIVGVAIGVLVILLLLLIGSLLLLCRLQKKRSHQNNGKGPGDSLRSSTKRSSAYSYARGGNLMDEGVAYHITFSEIEEATKSFSKQIGKGSFGPVYYGKMKDDKEVAVKTMADSSSHGTRQFVTEIALLSRIHHRNLVPLIGYCEEEHRSVLVYEYMHNGTLRDHIHDSSNQKHLDWLARLQIAEDAAKGLEYLHSGCNPSIIHRDVKTSNILLDINMRAKVSDFGLSRQAEEDLTHVSSVAQGTVGYLDPGYYANHQLTEKSDIYSFGVVLLELVSGKKPVSIEDFGIDWNIVHWARSMIRKGDVISIIDPCIAEKVKIESIWRVAEVAIQCVEQHSSTRPRMQEIIVAIQDAIKIEKGSDKVTSGGSAKSESSRRTLLTSFLDIQSPDLSDDSLAPSAR